MTMKLLLAIPLILFFLYVLALPKYQLLGKLFILVFVAILLLFALNPEFSTLIANYFGVGRGADSDGLPGLPVGGKRCDSEAI